MNTVRDLKPVTPERDSLPSHTPPPHTPPPHTPPPHTPHTPHAEPRWPRAPRWALITLGFVVLALIAVGLVPRLRDAERRAIAEAQAAEPLRVAIAKVLRAPSTIDVTLPATAEPLRSTLLYARAAGYVRRIAADLGDNVKQGALLAELQAPETTEELRVLKARVDEATRNVELARTSAQRQAELAQTGATSIEQADVARARANSAEASLSTSNAELKRLSEVIGYQRLVAPYPGVITKRLADIGTLVAPGSTALFELSDVSILRVFVDVPQSAAADVRVGATAKVFDPRRPGAISEGKVVRTSGALDRDTRTLRAEIHLPGDAMLPGSFVQVALAVTRQTPPLLAPSSALSIRKEGPTFVRVSADGLTERVVVTLGRDLGKEIEVLSGLAEGDTIVISPPDVLGAGQRVTPLPVSEVKK